MRITHRIHYLVWWLNLYSICFSKIEAHCTGNGLLNCACNFINACKYDASNKIFNKFSGSINDLEKFIPNVKSFATPTSQVAEICEPGNIGIIYDCKNLIPLASTLVLTADKYGASGYRRPTINFEGSLQIRDDFQQNDMDYKDTSQRVPCYETLSNQNFIEQKWYRALTNGKVVSNAQPCPPGITKSPIHRGHLIAASYGRGIPDRSEQTFVYTNAVPQFGKQNSGSWRIFERNLLEWAINNCMGAPLHVIVGTIPSTYGTNDWRFYGEAGFSNFNGPSNIFFGKSPYRVNVPAFMWTAACCHSASPLFTKSTAFFAPNEPGRRLVRSVKLSGLFFVVGVPAAVNLFPGMPSCNDDGNYIQI